MTGGQLDLSALKSNSKIQSILWVGYPGQSGGDAIAQVIFGKRSPAGRLPVTYYTANYVNQVSLEDMGMRPNASNGNPGRTYRFFTGTPVYEFGTGLSYTNFTYKWISNKETHVSASQINKEVSKDTTFKWNSQVAASHSVQVSNIGNVESDVVVLAFLVPPNPGKDGNPLKYL